MNPAPSAGPVASIPAAVQPLAAHRPDPFDPVHAQRAEPGRGVVLHGWHGDQPVRRFVGTRTTPEAAAALAEQREAGTRFTHYSLRGALS